MNGKLSQLLAGSVMMLICGLVHAADEPMPEVPAVGPVVGDTLPAFESVDEQGVVWKSADHVGKKVLVLYFYPGDFTGGCIKQAEAYRDGLAKLEELGADVVGVSADEVASHKLFKETYGMKHGLLADTKGDLAKLLGVRSNQGGRTRAVDGDRKPVLDAEGKPILIERSLTFARHTIVIGRDGKIAAMRKIVNPVTDSEEVRKIVEGLHK